MAVLRSAVSWRSEVDAAVMVVSSTGSESNDALACGVVDLDLAESHSAE